MIRLFFDILRRDWRTYAVFVIFILALVYWLSFSSPRHFPIGGIVDIQSGASLAELSETLESKGIIRSARAFRIVAISLGGERAMQAGDYYLPKSEDSFHLAWRVVHAEHEIPLVRITIPEGYTNTEISKLFDTRFPLLDHAAFLSAAPEGYLFPDTYFIQVNATASTTLGLLQDNFHKKVDPLDVAIEESGHSIYNIIDVASIIQEEVGKPEDMALVSGIIWKRLKLDMPLQVDAAPDTYKKKGLPPAPIDNPGLNAIKAAINPTDSPYLYYISDKQGVTHYAKTLDEQDANINKYLE